ncbi:MAG TPA: FUSC family protein [Baekduia sp.]|nr:FUSC family protein [Baekduia sp.]
MPRWGLPDYRREWRPRARASAQERLGRLRADSVAILQGAVAATLAWWLATEILGHSQPFFAPLSALIAIGMSHRHRTRRTAELVLGVAIGIGIADLLVAGIGVGTWQLFLILVLATGVAVLIGPGRTFVSQAAVSAMLVATVQPPGSGLAGERFIDALLGGGIALLVAVVLPANPVRAVDRAAHHVLDELAAVLDLLAEALRDVDRDLARRALERARALDEEERGWREAVDTGSEIVRTTPAYRGTRDVLEAHAVASAQMDLAQRNIRVLARAVVRAIDVEDNVPHSLADSLETLGRAFRFLSDDLARSEHGAEARSAALAASTSATEALGKNASLSTSMIVGQIRSTTVDLMRGLGEEGSAARAAVRAAVGDTDHG